MADLSALPMTLALGSPTYSTLYTAMLPDCGGILVPVFSHRPKDVDLLRGREGSLPAAPAVALSAEFIMDQLRDDPLEPDLVNELHADQC